MNKTYLLAILFSASLIAQNNDPEELIRLVKNNFQTITDYSVDVTVSIDITILKAPTTKAKVYFKQPNKVKIESEGFALIPKQGLNFFLTELLESDYSPIYIRSDKFENFQVEVIKVIPMSDTTDIILTTLWIDPLIKVIRKIEMNTKSVGLIEVQLRYNDAIERVLPSDAIFTFQTNEDKSDSRNEDQNQSGKKLSKSKISGTVKLEYSNYIVNQGIDDSFFEQEKK